MNDNAARDVFFAIADPTRREILSILLQNSLPLKDISKNFDVSRTAISKHLKVLRSADLIKSQKIGRETVFEITPEPLIEVEDWLDHYSKFWDTKLKSLKNFVENSDF